MGLHTKSTQVPGQFRARAHADLCVEPREGRFDRANAHKQTGRDLLVREARGDELADLALPGRRLGVRRATTGEPGEVRGRPFRPAGSPELVEALKSVGERRACGAPATRSPLDAPGELDRPRMLKRLREVRVCLEGQSPGRLVHVFDHSRVAESRNRHELPWVVV